SRNAASCTASTDPDDEFAVVPRVPRLRSGARARETEVSGVGAQRRPRPASRFYRKRTVTSKSLLVERQQRFYGIGDRGRDSHVSEGDIRLACIILSNICYTIEG